MPNSDFFCGRNTFFFGSRHCAAVLSKVDIAQQFFASRKKVHRPRSQSPLHFTLGTYGKFARKKNFLAMAFAFRSPARALPAGLPRQDHIYRTTDESFRFHNKNFDEMRCKLDSTENPRSFEKYPTPP